MLVSRLPVLTHLSICFAFCATNTQCYWLDLFIMTSVQFSSVQSLSRVWLFVTLWTATHQASLSITNSRSLLKLMSIESVMPSNHLILCHPLLFPGSGSFEMSEFFTSGGQVLEFQLQHQSFQWIFRTDFLRMDWVDLLAVQGTQESSPTPQFNSINSLALSFLLFWLCGSQQTVENS